VTRQPRMIRYELPGGWTLLVGGSDSDNEQLSLEIASPDKGTNSASLTKLMS
jgi:hypothetical protein